MTELQKCFLTDKECQVIDISYDGSTYFVDEAIADENPLKKIREMIQDKIDKTNKEKSEALDLLSQACDKLGISKEALGNLLLGKENKSTTAEPTSSEKTTKSEHKSEQTKNKLKNQDDDGFIPVDGSLKSDIKTSVNSEEGIGAALPAYNTVHDKDGSSIREEGKKVKRLDDAVISKSNMGTTVIRMDHRKASEIEPLLKQVDGNGNLVRAATSGRGFLSGAKTIDCPMCQGSGIARIGYQKCPKCDGSGLITV